MKIFTKELNAKRPQTCKLQNSERTLMTKRENFLVQEVLGIFYRSQVSDEEMGIRA